MISKSNNYIRRGGYLEKITPFINQNLIKVMVGQKILGKSYLLFQEIDFERQKNEITFM